MSNSLAELVKSGFADALAYESYRPSYPVESVSKLLDNLKVSNVPEARILEIGAGTGKLTEQLVAKNDRYQIIAVEPHAPMRQILDGKGLKGVKVLDGTATNLVEVEKGWADAVVVAQAFHWFANTDALEEIYRVTKPCGTLGLIWNFEDYNSGVEWTSTTAWEEKLKQMLWPNHNHRKWQDVFDTQLTTPLYFPIEEDIFVWTVWLSKEAIWDRFRTMSVIAVQKGKQFEETKRVVFDAMNGEDVETNDHGEIALHGRTETFWTTAIPAMSLNSSL